MSRDFYFQCSKKAVYTIAVMTIFEYPFKIKKMIYPTNTVKRYQQNGKQPFWERPLIGVLCLHNYTLQLQVCQTEKHRQKPTDSYNFIIATALTISVILCIILKNILNMLTGRSNAT